MTCLETEMHMATVIEALRRNRFDKTAADADRALEAAGLTDALKAMIAADDAGKTLWLVEYWGHDAKAPADCHPDFFTSPAKARKAANAFMRHLGWAERFTLRVTLNPDA